MSKHKNYNVQEIQNYWQNTSLTVNQIAEKTGISSDMIRYYIKKLNIVRPKELEELEKKQTQLRRKQTRLKKNEGNYFSQDSIDKRVQTRLSKNDGNYFSQDSLNKRQQTNLERYGVVNVFQNNAIQKKAMATKQDKYDDKYYNNRKQAVITRLNNNDGKYMTDEMLQKSKDTTISKYGKEFYVQTDEYKQQAKSTRFQKNDGKYFSDSTIERLRQSAKDNYKSSNIKRIKTIQNRYDSYKSMFYTDNPKMQFILQDVKTNLKNYIQNLETVNRNFAYIEGDLGISYNTLLRLLKQCNFKDLLTNTRSHFQQEVITFIKSLNINYIENARSIIKPYELDIYIPENHVAIECNGTYWHSYQNNTDKNYHYNKSVLCEEQGVRLIHIFEYEWYNERQRPILENIIKNALGVNTNKIYARKLNIEVRKSAEMREFFDKNNIQGFRGGKFAICLVDKDTREVYMAYMMGHSFFGKGKYEWEVIRGATKLGYTVVGGASKIFSYFVKTYNPMNCVYYIDYNYFNGNSLKNLPQMRFIKTQPSFKNYWKDTGTVKNREPQRNKEITELYKTGKVLQIFNAGTKVYVWYKE